jgi:peptidoglycan/xylan/chitin deacetylase (PgdA/CDA1 family)
MALTSILSSGQTFAAVREIALTIDDLPFVGANNQNARSIQRTNDRIQAIIQTLIDHKIPATGFIIGEALVKQQLPLIEEFHANGFALGNHTYTHKNLNRLTAEKYIEDVDKADKKLASVMTTPKYFRYPYLAEGTGAKKQAVFDYLAKHNYTIAPVTIDSKDYNFNAQLLSIPWRRRTEALKSMKTRYLAYIWNQTLKAEARAAKNPEHARKQILLIHANLLNSYFLGDVIDMFQKNSYVFIPLSEAVAAQTPHTTLKASDEQEGSNNLKDEPNGLEDPNGGIKNTDAPRAEPAKKPDTNSENASKKNELSSALQTLQTFFVTPGTST